MQPVETVMGATQPLKLKRLLLYLQQLQKRKKAKLTRCYYWVYFVFAVDCWCCLIVYPGSSKKTRFIVVCNKKATGRRCYSESAAYYDEADDTPIAQFMTTFMLGDDLYDDSFSVDSPTGEFWVNVVLGFRRRLAWEIPKSFRF